MTRAPGSTPYGAGMPRILRALLLAFTATLALATPASAALVINEIDYDQPSTDTAEFLEIANTGTEPVDLGTYSVRLINGGVTPAAQYRSFALPAVSARRRVTTSWSAATTRTWPTATST